MATHCQVANLLDKMNSSDKDIRLTAITDLLAELKKASIKLDDEIEKKIVKMLLNLLEDKVSEVQNLAVKCLGPLVQRVKNNHVEHIVETLCKNLTCEKEQLRDISCIGLKMVVTDLPKSSPELITVVCDNITDKLADVIQRKTDVPVQLEALDILSDLLSRFGNQLTKFYASIQQALLPLLEDSQQSAVRKLAITALAHLLTVCELELFNKTTGILLEQLTRHSQDDFALVPTYIQCISAISRLCGQRFGGHLEQIVPFIVQLSDNSDDELKENCIQAFEAFLLKAPKEITPYVPQITQICLNYLCYDPNYNYDNSVDDEEMGLDNEFENESSDEHIEDESNDQHIEDGMCWKVRRASAKCIKALVSTRHEMMIDLYKKVSPALIARYKEREENVKVDVFSAYISLLEQTSKCVSMYQTSSEDSPVLLLKSQVPNILKALHKQLKKKSVKTRKDSFSLLLELTNVVPDCLAEHLDIIVPGILYSLTEKNATSDMKIDTLIFLSALLKTHQPECFHPYLAELIPAVIQSVNDSFCQISSEALAVLTQLITVIRPSTTNTTFANYVDPIYKCTFIKLQASDLDQEVKERAIICMSQLINTFGDAMQRSLNEALSLLVEQLKNETTHLASIKAFIMIASAPFKINMASYLGTTIPIVAGFLREDWLALKINSLLLLDVLVKNHIDDITEPMIKNVLDEAQSLINKTDLHVSQLTLKLLISLINSGKAFFPIITDTILKATLVLVRNPLPGSLLQSAIQFYKTLALKQFLTFDQLLTNLSAPMYSAKLTDKAIPLEKQIFSPSIAKCVSAIAITDEHRALKTVASLLEDCERYQKQDGTRAFALLTIGEIGKKVDLSSIAKLKELLIRALDSQSEEVKSAASFALGSISVGNLGEFLPFLIEQIEKSNQRQHLLLNSLKEIISCQLISDTTGQTLQPYLEPIWTLLTNHCQCSEEGTRNVVAECLGKLITMNPNELLPRLQSYLTHENSLARSTVVTAVKFTISEQPQSIDPLLKKCIDDFLKTLEDGDKDLVNFKPAELTAIVSSKCYRASSLDQDGNYRAALMLSLGAVSASPNIIERKECLRRCHDLLPDTNIELNTWHNMLVLAFKKSRDDYGLTREVLEFNTKVFEEQIGDDLKDLIEIIKEESH